MDPDCASRICMIVRPLVAQRNTVNVYALTKKHGQEFPNTSAALLATMIARLAIAAGADAVVWEQAA